MADFLEFGIWLAGAVVVVGLMQWLKKLAETALKAPLPGWLLLFLMPLASLAAGAAAGGPNAIWRALGIWAVAQIGYEGILKGILERTGGGAEPEPPKVGGFTG